MHFRESEFYLRHHDALSRGLEPRSALNQLIASGTRHANQGHPETASAPKRESVTSGPALPQSIPA